MFTIASVQDKLRNAAEVSASLWMAGVALAIGAVIAWIVIHFLPAHAEDVLQARELGIVSETVVAGYSKSADSRAYIVGLGVTLVCSIAIWTAWATRAGRNVSSAPPPETPIPRIGRMELAIAALIAFGIFARIWNGRAATLTAWSALTEEGEMLAWVNTVLRGGALSRDTFCVYGPLSVWLVAALFCVFHPSIGLWRAWIFGLNAAALVATYCLLRGITRTRTAAAAGAVLVGVLCVGSVPAMSWSLSRVGFGLAALAALNRAMDRASRTWYIIAGVLGASALLYSPEVGISCAIAIAVVLLLRSSRWFGILWTILGGLVVACAGVAYLIATASLWPTIQNATLFSHVRLLGFCALIFPRLELNVESLRDYSMPAIIAAAGFVIITKLLRGRRDARVWTELGLVIFGGILLNAAISRPDDVHLPFVAPPAIILLTGLVEDAWFEARLKNHRVPAIAAIVLAVAALVPWTTTAADNVRALFEPPSGRALRVPRGGNALFPNDFASDLENLTQAIQTRTATDEPIWFFPNEAMLYFLTDRPEATRFPLAMLAATRAQREQLIADLERTRPRWAIVLRDAPLLDRIPYSKSMPEVVAYLNSNYELDQNIGPFMLLRRKG